MVDKENGLSLEATYDWSLIVSDGRLPHGESVLRFSFSFMHLLFEEAHREKWTPVLQQRNLTTVIRVIVELEPLSQQVEASEQDPLLRHVDAIGNDLIEVEFIADLVSRDHIWMKLVCNIVIDDDLSYHLKSQVIIQREEPDQMLTVPTKTLEVVFCVESLLFDEIFIV